MTVTAEPQVSYGLSEEHEALRASVRDFAETVVAPRSAEVDRTATYPWDLHEGLRKNELLACTSRSSTAAPAPTRSPPRSSSRSCRASTRASGSSSR
jgi:alkylation response protein AidB-like acyl-CoA dehydrogenase